MTHLTTRTQKYKARTKSKFKGLSSLRLSESFNRMYPYATRSPVDVLEEPESRGTTEQVEKPEVVLRLRFLWPQHP